jgi:hypothetical protein
MAKISIPLDMRMSVVIDVDPDINGDPSAHDVRYAKELLTKAIKGAVDPLVSPYPYDGCIVELEWK